MTFTTAANAQITNQSFVQFFDYATAGSAAITNVDNANATLSFYENSNAAQANLYNGVGDAIYFWDDTSAGSSTILNNGLVCFTGDGNGVSLFHRTSASITNNAVVDFADYATAGNASVSNLDNLNATTNFYGNANVGQANLYNGVGDLTYFFSDTSAGSATLVNNGSLFSPEKGMG